MTYDEARRVTLMFGGGNRQGALDDLWSWDGSGWRRLATGGPSARSAAVFAYDPRRRIAVLHGGRTPKGLTNDTWEWDGSRWTERPVAGPALRLHHHGAFDRRRNRLVVYGGLDVAVKPPTPLPDTWEFDGTAWTRLDMRGIDGFPNAVAYSERRGQVVALAVTSTGPPEGMEQTTTWTWDGTRWTRQAGPGEPAVSPIQPIAATAQGLLMLDGAMHRGTEAITWLWERGQWTRSAASPPTPQRVSHALAWDSHRRRIVMFGGHAGFMPGRTGEMFGDTWEWDGKAWHRRGT